MTAMIIAIRRTTRPDRTISTSCDVSSCIRRRQLITPDMRKRRPAEAEPSPQCSRLQRGTGRGTGLPGAGESGRRVYVILRRSAYTIIRPSARRGRVRVDKLTTGSTDEGPATGGPPASRRTGCPVDCRHGRGLARVSDPCLATQGLCRAQRRHQRRTSQHIASLQRTSDERESICNVEDDRTGRARRCAAEGTSAVCLSTLLAARHRRRPLGTNDIPSRRTPRGHHAEYKSPRHKQLQCRPPPPLP